MPDVTQLAPVRSRVLTRSLPRSLLSLESQGQSHYQRSWGGQHCSQNPVPTEGKTWGHGWAPLAFPTQGPARSPDLGPLLHLSGDTTHPPVRQHHPQSRCQPDLPAAPDPNFYHPWVACRASDSPYLALPKPACHPHQARTRTHMHTLTHTHTKVRSHS